MQTTLNQINDVEYELEIDAKAEELAPQIKKRLREHQASITMKGFRPGKVPISMLKKMYGESLVIDVIERSVMNVFNDEVIEPGDYEVLGSPVVSELEYKLDGDLHAVMKFGVKPAIELKDFSDQTILKLVHDITDDEIDNELQAMLRKEADLRTRDKGGIEDTDHVIIDMQRLDAKTMTPIIGAKDENLEFFLDDEKLKDGLRDALLGKENGETFRVNLPLDEDGSKKDPDAPSSDLLVLPTDDPNSAQEMESYEVHVKEVKERHMPELDADLIKEMTREQAEDEEGLKEYIKEGLTRSWTNESRKLLEGELISKVLEMHAFTVPDSAVEVYLNSFVQEIKQQMGNKLPENFDLAAFKDARRPDAERLARWQLIRDHIVDAESFEVTDEDRKEHFSKIGGNEEMAETLLKYYASMGGDMLDRVDQELVSAKVIDFLAEQFAVEEKNKDDYVEALKERQKGQDALIP